MAIEHPKQERYRDATGKMDFLDEFFRDSNDDEIRGAMIFTMQRYLKRLGKKDDPVNELMKVNDYSGRYIKHILAQREAEKEADAIKSVAVKVLDRISLKADEVIAKYPEYFALMEAFYENDTETGYTSANTRKIIYTQLMGNLSKLAADKSKIPPMKQVTQVGNSNLIKMLKVIPNVPEDRSEAPAE